MRDHQTHLKRIDEIVKSKKKTVRDLVLLEHIRNMHQAKAVSRKTMQTGFLYKSLIRFKKKKEKNYEINKKNQLLFEKIIEISQGKNVPLEKKL